MTEEEQLALALQMSMSGLMEGDMQPMETEGPTATDQVSTTRMFSCHLVTVQVNIYTMSCSCIYTQTHVHVPHHSPSPHTNTLCTLIQMHTTHIRSFIHTQGYGEVMDDEDEDDEEGMDELMQNPEFLHSVLSSLPGVNPEEALQNLEQMKDNKKVELRVQLVWQGRRGDQV